MSDQETENNLPRVQFSAIELRGLGKMVWGYEQYLRGSSSSPEMKQRLALLQRV